MPAVLLVFSFALSLLDATQLSRAGVRGCGGWGPSLRRRSSSVSSAPVVVFIAGALPGWCTCLAT